MAKEKVNWGIWESVLKDYLEPSAWLNVKWNTPNGGTRKTKATNQNGQNPSQESGQITAQAESVRDYLIRRKHNTNLYDNFDKAVWSKVKIADKEKYKDFLIKMAALESDFRPDAVFANKKDHNKDALGLFQILDKFIKHYTNDPNMTREKFLKDPIIQTEAAIRMAKENYRILTQDKNKDYLEDIAKQGFDVWDAMAAGWLSGANGSISSWREAKSSGKFREDANGTNTNERMLAFKQLTV